MFFGSDVSERGKISSLSWKNQPRIFLDSEACLCMRRGGKSSYHLFLYDFFCSKNFLKSFFCSSRNLSQTVKNWNIDNQILINQSRCFFDQINNSKFFSLFYYKIFWFWWVQNISDFFPSGSLAFSLLSEEKKVNSSSQYFQSVSQPVHTISHKNRMTRYKSREVMRANK